ncbi:uncharacterized protein BO97DRAFT_425690 [Aspergillus homomorphus CBS 101889]|uniref:Uncharacterized protein n=1 Tax=Aspergillus homomorphus (strain CBS 101889) TaxID=1450537 RepID=A0A395HU83_ASPHC|nr:hypothetical protein BO97DRAFT_425690 [Aspergillus homomorphus CBS 101889]RAL11377.1 hypothetical protein BO97DRAFT_425690 [Aspergillus homomorphus CBS 101889]
MSLFSSITSWLCCIPSPSPAATSNRETTPPNHQPTHSPRIHHQDANNEGYLPPSPPLPAYTPHPHTLTEKTLALHPRSSSISSLNEKPAASPSSSSSSSSSTTALSQPPISPSPTIPPAAPTPPPAPSYPPYYHHHYRLSDPDESDTSSTLSFPSTSSYGNTSTATRETPPPPYSPRSLATTAGSRTMSPVPSLMSDSGRSHSSGGSSSDGQSVAGFGFQQAGRRDEEMVQIAAPRPVVVWDGRAGRGAGMSMGMGWGDIYEE